MAKTTKKPKTVPTLDRPLVPGSPLYRMLELIARRVAEDLKKQAPATKNNE